MKYVILFEEWNQDRFASKEDSEEYYRNLNPIKPIEERTYSIDKLKDFDIPDEIIDKMKSWEIIIKSPYSNTFYNSKETSWNFKADKSFRVSDHWNFEANGYKHCLTEEPVKNVTHISLGQYDKKNKKYKILLTLPSPSFLQKIEMDKRRKEFMQNPEIINKKREFKKRIENKEIICILKTKNNEYKGIVRKYTGSELKIEDENGELIYNKSRLDNPMIEFFDREGNLVINPIDIKMEKINFKTMKYLKQFEELNFFDI